MTIQVTIDDIVEGRVCNTKCCPIALAAQRAFPRAKDMHVGTLYISFMCEGAMHWYNLPETAVQFIADFDSSYQVAPFSFETEKVYR